MDALLSKLNRDLSVFKATGFQENLQPMVDVIKGLSDIVVDQSSRLSALEAELGAARDALAKASAPPAQPAQATATPSK